MTSLLLIKISKKPIINAVHGDQDFSKFPIDTLLQYISDMDTHLENSSLYSPHISMVNNTFVTPTIDHRESDKSIITPAQFFRMQE